MKISIQSISDIITNSSSEVYLNTCYNAIDNFKIIIDELRKYAILTRKGGDDYATKKQKKAVFTGYGRNAVFG